MRQVPIVLALVLLTLAAALLAAAAVSDYRGRANSPESVVRRYFAALENGDVEAALDEITPTARPRSSEFVANGLFNSYRITGLAVREPSLLARALGQEAIPRDVTVFLDITQWTDDVMWQAAPRVPLVRVDGRWYLQHAPLGPA